MAWKTMDAESQRVEFIKAWKSGGRTFRGLCGEYGITRQCGYKWVGRYEEEGWAGLKEKSRAPHHVPARISARTEEELLRVRKLHPTWGPRKLLVVLERELPDLDLPAPSTAGEILKRNGLVEPRRRRTRHEQPRKPTAPVADVNDEWAIDFKGQFRTRDGRYCYPLTLADRYSRFILCCKAFDGIRGWDVQKALERVFREHGLPEAIRSDNGAPFCGTGLAGMSRLRVWLMKLGISHVRTRPGHPEDNGRQERMHRSLKKDTAIPPGKDLKEQQARFDAWRRDFNIIRPHEALGMKTPVELYRPSTRPFPDKVASPEYPAYYEVRLTSKGGSIKWRNHLVFVSDALRGEPLGLVEVDDGLWRVYFGSFELGVLDERDGWNDSKWKRVSTMCPV